MQSIVVVYFYITESLLPTVAVNKIQEISAWQFVWNLCQTPALSLSSRGGSLGTDPHMHQCYMRPIGSCQLAFSSGLTLTNPDVRLLVEGRNTVRWYLRALSMLQQLYSVLDVLWSSVTRHIQTITWMIDKTENVTCSCCSYPNSERYKRSHFNNN